MRLVRLSVFDASGERPHVLIPDTVPAKPRFAIHPLIHIATLLCLLGAIVITLLTLLLLNENYRLSVFSIEPLGSRIQAPPLVINASSSTAESPVPTGVQLRKRVLTNVTQQGPWPGLDGPTIYVGVMQLCSKVNNGAEVNCTSISEVARYEHLLPSNLASTITSLPKSPITPILLLAGGIATLMAVIVQLIGIALHISLTKNVSNFWRLRLWSATPPLPPKDGESSSAVGLVTPDLSKAGIPGSYIASQGLTIIGLGLSVGAAVLELQAVRNADRAWDDAAGKEAGLRFVFGTATYLIGLAPAALILAIIVSTVPLIRVKTVTPPPIEKDDPESKINSTQPEISEATAREIEVFEATQKESMVSDGDAVQVRSAPPRPPRSSLRQSKRWSLFHAV